ncbi:MAG: hypothetical protein EBZ87_06095 [Microbacteriaceae bacterium]|nr:hypothetical protein [Microbacteriaceae bacterium]
MVEAKVVYGLNVKEVVVPNNSGSSEIQSLLFSSLKGGCVYYLSAEDSLNTEVSLFAAKHQYIVALTVGGYSPANQPANVRWVADDLKSGAALAGFAAAAKATNGRVLFIIQDGYFNSADLNKAFRSGVAAFNEKADAQVTVTKLTVSKSAALQRRLTNVDGEVVLTLFADTSIWKKLDLSSRTGAVIGSDLQLGNSIGAVDRAVVASVERNYNALVLRVAKDVLDKNFALDPILMDPKALANGYIELRPLDDTVLDGTTTALLEEYKAVLVAQK